MSGYALQLVTQVVQTGIVHPPHFCRRLRRSGREIAHAMLSAREPSVLNASISSRGDSPNAGRWLTYTAGRGKH